MSIESDLEFLLDTKPDLTWGLLGTGAWGLNLQETSESNDHYRHCVRHESPYLLAKKLPKVPGETSSPVSKAFQWEAGWISQCSVGGEETQMQRGWEDILPSPADLQMQHLSIFIGPGFTEIRLWGWHRRSKERCVGFSVGLQCHINFY